MRIFSMILVIFMLFLPVIPIFAQGQCPQNDSQENAKGEEPPCYSGFAIVSEEDFSLLRVMVMPEALEMDARKVRKPQLIFLLEEEEFFLVEGEVVPGEKATENNNAQGDEEAAEPLIKSAKGKVSSKPYERPETMIDMQNDPEGTKAMSQTKGTPDIVGEVNLTTQMRGPVEVLLGKLVVKNKEYTIYAAIPPKKKGKDDIGKQENVPQE
jgi:hypothetical protein